MGPVTLHKYRSMHGAGMHLPGGHSLLCQAASFVNLLGENSVQAKFTRKAQGPGPEGLPLERPQYSRKVLSESYVQHSTKVLSVHKKPHKTRAQAREKPGRLSSEGDEGRPA